MGLDRSFSSALLNQQSTSSQWCVHNFIKLLLPKLTFSLRCPSGRLSMSSSCTLTKQEVPKKASHDSRRRRFEPPLAFRIWCITLSNFFYHKVHTYKLHVKTQNEDGMSSRKKSYIFVVTLSSVSPLRRVISVGKTIKTRSLSFQSCRPRLYARNR